MSLTKRAPFITLDDARHGVTYATRKKEEEIEGGVFSLSLLVSVHLTSLTDS